MAWDAWGSQENRRPLTAHTRSVLRSILGITAQDEPPKSEHDVRLRPSTLTGDSIQALATIVGVDHVTTDDAVRILHLGGKSTIDLLRRRNDEVHQAPDAVVFPAGRTDIESLLAFCSDNSIAVVPFGGGTSVVGGLDPVREWFDDVIAVSLRRMRGMTDLDTVSRTATFQAGVTGPEAEEMLGRHGLTLGHFPQSFQYATIGGFAATRSSGQASAGYGRFDDMVQALTVVTPIGTVEPGRTAPASAAGPDIRQVFLGSEGTLGIVTDVTVRARELPETTTYRAWRFDDFAAGAEAFRVLAAVSSRPTVMRLSDETETGINAAMSESSVVDASHGGCLAITTFDGSAEDVAARMSVAESILVHGGAHPVDEAAARAWEHGRFDGPYLRDALLDVGALAETLETATNWSRLTHVRSAVTSALTESLRGAGTPPVVLCHISHVYETGASLYFTVVCAAAADPITQWRDAKAAATDAMIAAGATLTHHHAVGRDHRDWMVQEIGPVGAAVLRAIKSAVDPAGVLNPGKLIP
ncbi:FAD-binding oxidoreductase [Rhodococcoides yunnanense]|uniref:FAD-binding oxidoreductase n=1 Tax=Rhodococcoides yunnanense TaxID=278209 RepID=UPI0009355B8F|nr:FAD-binding oxidoreductase [Rhodococcus yunnanensis]